MEVITKTEIREVSIKSYIAKDGKEFTSERECRDYEERMEREEACNSIKDLLVYDDTVAKIPCDGGENYENHVWEWYKVENQEQLNRLNVFFNTCAAVEIFPEYVCIEHYDDDEGYSQTLTNCIDYVKRFFKDFGYGVELTKM